MPRPESFPFVLTLPWRTAAAVAALAWCGHLLYRRLLGETFPAPFYWSDVALVSLLAALPPLAVCADWLSRKLGRDETAALGSGGYRFVVLMAAIACAVLLPWLYVKARCRHDQARLEELASQSRSGRSGGVGAAVGRPFAAGCFPRAAPADRRRGDGQRGRRTAPRVGQPLPAGASGADRLARARDLAQLGEGGAALALLDASPDLAASFAGLNLRGLVHLDRNEYSAALAAFQAAGHSLAALPPSPDAAPQIEPLRQIAYCQRKLGRYAEAEAAYRELLTARPFGGHALSAGPVLSRRAAGPGRSVSCAAGNGARSRRYSAARPTVDRQPDYDSLRLLGRLHVRAKLRTNTALTIEIPQV